MFLNFISFIIFLFILCKIIFKITCGRCKSKVTLIGKTAIVTGGNRGIGYETCLGLASRGCRVIIADKDDLTDTKSRIIKETNNPNIICKYLDLKSFKSISVFVKEIYENEEKLEILINNAGIGSHDCQYTEDGNQETFQVNYLGPFLLTYLLLDLLQKSAPSRVIFVSSLLAFFSNLKLQDLRVPRSYFDHYYFFETIYSNSKLCLIIASNEFTNRYPNSGITFNSLHPGVCMTHILDNIARNDYLVKLGILQIILKYLVKNAEESAQTSIYLAIAKEVENISGGFFLECRQFWLPSKAKDKEFGAKVWDETIKIVKLN